MTKRRYLDEQIAHNDKTLVVRPNMDIQNMYVPNLNPNSGHKNYFNAGVDVYWPNGVPVFYDTRPMYRGSKQITKEEAIKLIKDGWISPDVKRTQDLIFDISLDKYSTNKRYTNKLGVRRSLATGGSIYIKPSHRGRLTELKARTGKSEAELYNDGNPAHKKMVVFARNARKWHH